MGEAREVLARLVSDSSRATGVPTVNGIVDPYFSNARQGIALNSECVFSATADTTCTLVIVGTRASYPFIGFTTNGRDGWIYGSETFVTHNGGTILNSGEFYRTSDGGIHWGVTR